MVDLPKNLVFHPHPVWDPAIWRIIDETDKSMVTAAANIQLEQMHATATANLKAIEQIQKLLATGKAAP